MNLQELTESLAERGLIPNVKLSSQHVVSLEYDAGTITVAGDDLQGLYKQILSSPNNMIVPDERTSEDARKDLGISKAQYDTLIEELKKEAAISKEFAVARKTQWELTFEQLWGISPQELYENKLAKADINVNR